MSQLRTPCDMEMQRSKNHLWSAHAFCLLSPRPNPQHGWSAAPGIAPGGDLAGPRRREANELVSDGRRGFRQQRRPTPSGTVAQSGAAVSPKWATY
ncbi:hypothetical protein MRX96_058225 [Rhipicephalus microplus]